MRSSPLLPIFLIVAVDVLGLTIMIPLLPFYAEKLGASPFQVGWLIGIYAMCQLISGPLLGRMSDHTGRKPLLIVSQIGTFIGFIVTAFAPNLWILFLARAIDGSTAGNLSLAQAYISDVTEPKDRAKSFGIIGISFGMGFLIGPAISGFLAGYDYRYPILAAALLSATSILATSLLLPSVKPGEGKGTWSRWYSGSRWSNGAPTSNISADPCWRLGCSSFSPSPSASPCLFPAFRCLSSAASPITACPSARVQLGYVWAFAGFLGIFLQGPDAGTPGQALWGKGAAADGFRGIRGRLRDPGLLPYAFRC